MKFVWNIDRQTEITLQRGLTGTQITVAGQRLPGRIRLKGKRATEFKLGDGRLVSILMRESFVSVGPKVQLRVDGELMHLTTKHEIRCRSCAARMMPNDKFCESCGLEAPSAVLLQHHQTTQRARKMIIWLAVLFVVWALAAFVISSEQIAPVLAKLASRPASEQLKPTKTGKVYTVGEARAELRAEPVKAMAVNLLLAAIMACLALWSRRAPVAPLIFALAIFIAVHALNALINPVTLAQGIIFKILIVVYLANGIRSALALRAADADGV